MFLLSKKKWNVDHKNSFMIGDQKTDVEFARRAKIKGYLFNQKNLYQFIKKKIIQPTASLDSKIN
jgi:histidinol phosphatase-like enzyme